MSTTVIRYRQRTVAEQLAYYQNQIEQCGGNQIVIMFVLDKLLDLQVSVLHLQLIHIGRTVKSLCYGDGCVAAVAKQLLEKWRHLVVAADQPVVSGRSENKQSSKSERPGTSLVNSVPGLEFGKNSSVDYSMPLLNDPDEDASATSHQRPQAAGRRRIDNDSVSHSSSGIVGSSSTAKKNIPNPATICKQHAVPDRQAHGSINSSNSSCTKTQTKAARERALQRAPLMRKSIKLVNFYRKRRCMLKCPQNNE